MINKKRVVAFLSILVICLIVNTSVFASIGVKAENGLTVDVKFKGYTIYNYPYLGLEHIMGPERTYYHAFHFNENNESICAELIREADDFVLCRIYPDFSFDVFEKPELTEEQKENFRKYHHRTQSGDQIPD